jgi:hypothetical protein
MLKEKSFYSDLSVARSLTHEQERDWEPASNAGPFGRVGA